MKRTWIFISIALLGVVIILSLKYVFNSDKINVKTQKSDFVIGARELFYDFESNETQATNKYLNKIIQVHGNIGKIIQTPDKKSVVILKDKNEFFGINCMITDKEFRFESLKEGDSVSVRGVLKGYLNDVILSDCAFIK
jgi:hypothetical protein